MRKSKQKSIDKLKLDISKESDKEENEKALQSAVSNISTLNTKLNNQLKDLYQEETTVKTRLKVLFDGKKTELLEIKNQTEEKTKTEIARSDRRKYREYIIQEINQSETKGYNQLKWWNEVAHNLFN